MSDAVMITEWERTVVKHTCSFRLWTNWARRLGLKGSCFGPVTEVGDNWGLPLTCESAPKHMQVGSTSKSTNLETFYSKNEPFRRQTLASSEIWKVRPSGLFFEANSTCNWFLSATKKLHNIFKHHISRKDEDVCSDEGLADLKLQLKWTKCTAWNGQYLL